MIPEHIYLPQPPAGCKAWLLERPGCFVLERGPGTLITDACTHAGSGSLMLIDGIPDERGYFPAEIPAPTPGSDEWMAWCEANGKRNGRPFFRANPVVMGSWMLNAGFLHGLTVIVPGGHVQSACPVATIVWQPYRVRVA